MTDEAGTQTPQRSNERKLPAAALFAILVGILVFAFRDGLIWAATDDWPTDEYNHCYLIPFISLFLLATWARDLAAVPWTGAKAGLWVLGFSFVLLLLGEFSAIYTISQVGFVIGVIGAAIAVFGMQFFRIAWPALVYLFFMVPLPDFLQVQLTADLQLISSRLGVAFVRLFGPVYLEGNIIDLGNYKLAVAEACSGLRYLFPLMSFGFLCAVLYQAPLWQRAVVFLSTIPITVLMNSLRIGIIGLLVTRGGIEQAEGFMHDFEGWVVFMVCVGILFLEMFILSRLSGRRLLRSLRMDTPPVAEMMRIMAAQPAHRMALVAGALVIAGGVLSAGLEKREDLVPRRGELATFPLRIGDWVGDEQYIEPTLLDAVQADDTLAAAYRRSADPIPIGMWIAYYSSQRSGRAVHSPRVCLPGGGWEIQSFEERTLENITPDGRSVPVNRVIIGLGDDRQLVYYWFSQRGRLLTNEYVVKWYIFWDALTRNRTDGALVRLTTYIDKGTDGLADADRRLQDFIRDVDPKLTYFIPQRDAELLQARAD
jgi:exosortase D (VPLPA-CTERM-specific)